MYMNDTYIGDIVPMRQDLKIFFISIGNPYSQTDYNDNIKLVYTLGRFNVEGGRK